MGTRSTSWRSPDGIDGAAIRFFRKLLKIRGGIPRRLITDKLPSCGAACRTVMPSVVHRTDQYANNRAEVSHERTRTT